MPSSLPFVQGRASRDAGLPILAEQRSPHEQKSASLLACANVVLLARTRIARPGVRGLCGPQSATRAASVPRRGNVPCSALIRRAATRIVIAIPLWAVELSTTEPYASVRAVKSRARSPLRFAFEVGCAGGSSCSLGRAHRSIGACSPYDRFASIRVQPELQHLRAGSPAATRPECTCGSEMPVQRGQTCGIGIGHRGGVHQTKGLDCRCRIPETNTGLRLQVGVDALAPRSLHAEEEPEPCGRCLRQMHQPSTDSGRICVPRHDAC